MHRTGSGPGSRIWLCIATAGVLFTAACASAAPHVQPVHPSPSSPADKSATAAGYKMDYYRGPLPARAAALRVTGTTQSAESVTSVTALTARGTTWNGTVVLRFAVESDNGHDSSKCFRYQYEYPRTAASGVPRRVSCPRRKPIDLHHPPLPNGVTAATQRTVARVMAQAVTVKPFTAAVVRADLRRALGTDYTDDVGFEPGEPGTLDGFVRYGQECLLVHVADGSSDVQGPFSGNTCFGG